MKLMYTEKLASGRALAEKIFFAVSDAADVAKPAKPLKWVVDHIDEVWEGLKSNGIWTPYEGMEIGQDVVLASGEPSDFMGFHKTGDDLQILGLSLNGTGECPVHVAVFWDGTALRVAIPISGNPFNTRTGRPYGRDLCADSDNMTLRIMQEQFSGVDVDTMPVVQSDEPDREEVREHAGDLMALIKPRADLMLRELAADVVYYDEKAEAAQQLELPDPDEVLDAVESSSLDEALKLDITERVRDAVELDESYADVGALVCGTDAVDQWRAFRDDLLPPECEADEEAEMLKELEKKAFKALRDHFREALPSDFPLPVRSEDGDILFKPGGRGADDVEGEDFHETQRRHELIKFKKMNDVARKLTILEVQTRLKDLAEFSHALVEADVEVCRKEALDKEAEDNS